MIKRNGGKQFNQYLIGMLVVILASCLAPKTITREYNFSGEEPCDCYTKHPLLQFGTKSTFYFKEKAFCTRSNFSSLRDSISKLEELKMEIEYSDYPLKLEDSIVAVAGSMDSVIHHLKSGWTHVKIKTRWSNSAGSTRTLKEKITYYNKFKFGRKFVGMKKYKKGVLIKSKVKL